MEKNPCCFTQKLLQMYWISWYNRGFMSNAIGKNYYHSYRYVSVVRWWGPWRNSYNHRDGWRHEQHNLSHCHWPHRDSNDLRSYSLVMTQQSNATTCLLLGETCCSRSFTSNQAATRSAWSLLSLEMKQEHVELDYTPGILLCPPQSDDGDNCTWIFTRLDVNILACQPCTSPVPTSVHLYRSVKFWSHLYLATLP